MSAPKKKSKKKREVDPVVGKEAYLPDTGKKGGKKKRGVTGKRKEKKRV